jgi:hypothetical protein
VNQQFDWEKPENTLDFGLVKDALDKLLRAVENKIEREWPLRLGGTVWHAGPFLFATKVARWTYVASLYLLADSPPDPSRHLEYAVVVPPLNRTILDMTFSAVFIFDDFDDRLCWYLHSGLDEVQRKIQRFKVQYGADPAWSTFFARIGAAESPFLKNRDAVCRGRAPAYKGRFPHPGKIISGSIPFKDASRLDFLKYLNDWFYRDLSSSAHGHWSGLAERAAQVLRMQVDDDTQQRYAQKYKSDCIMQQITLILCLLSEIVVAADFDNKAQATYLWGILTSYWGEAKEVYEKRYQHLLT